MKYKTLSLDVTHWGDAACHRHIMSNRCCECTCHIWGTYDEWHLSSCTVPLHWNMSGNRGELLTKSEVGGWVQPGNRFVSFRSFVRACARCGCKVDVHWKTSGFRLSLFPFITVWFPFSLGWDLFPCAVEEQSSEAIWIASETKRHYLVETRLNRMKPG